MGGLHFYAGYDFDLASTRAAGGKVIPPKNKRTQK
jgi:hypothetical protein